MSKFRVVNDIDALRTAHQGLTGVGLAVALVEKITAPDEAGVQLLHLSRPVGNAHLRLHQAHSAPSPAQHGHACYHITDWNPEVSDLVLQLFNHVGLRGVANAEFKWDQRDGPLKLIECNARFTAVNCLVTAADWIWLGTYTSAFSASSMSCRRSTRPACGLLYPSNDLRAFLALRRTGELGLLPWLRSLAPRQTFPVMRWDHPRPRWRGARCGSGGRWQGPLRR